MRKIATKPQQKLSPKIIAAVALFLLVVAAGIFIWYNQSRPTPPTTSNTSDNHTPTKEEVANKPAPTTVPPSDIPVSTALTVSITKLEQTGGSVVVSGTVAGANGGTCVAEFTTPEDKPVVHEVKAVSNGTNATCGPITIDEIEFSYLGNWNAKLTFYTTDQSHQASSETKVITIK